MPSVHSPIPPLAWGRLLRSHAALQYHAGTGTLPRDRPDTPRDLFPPLQLGAAARHRQPGPELPHDQASQS